MTLKRLAKMANVSISTVSKALSDSKEISSETKAEIVKLAKENGCYEKYCKPKYDRKLIAVICPELLGIHYSQMVTCIEKEVSARGGTMLLSTSNFSPKTQRNLIEYYTKFAHVDGIIVIEPAEKIPCGIKTPIIQICPDDDSQSVHCINMDISTALTDAINQLLAYGHSKIGFIGETFTSPEYDLFEHYMKKSGAKIDPKYISVREERFYDCGYWGMDELIKRKNLPTAVFAAYSHIAVGIVQRLNEEHFKIPEDISIICMDDIKSSPYQEVKLSCIKMHLEELCSEAMHLLYRIFESNSVSAKHLITVEREFFEGESVSYPNEKR